MKFNNKLKLPQYIKLVDEIVEGYFDQTTGEYVPHIGEIHMAYLYFKNCVIAEEGDEVTPENIDTDDDVDFEKLEAVLNDSIFVHAIENNVFCLSDPFCVSNEYLSFGNAYHNAIEVIRARVENGGLAVQRIINGITNVADTLAGTFTEETVQAIAKAVEDIQNGKLSAESIANAYANSDRFKENTDEAKIIELPQQK